MTGPSASGSENGMPTSKMSAPAAAPARSPATKSLGVGKPAVRYVISAARPSALAIRQRSASRERESDKVVLDLDSVLERVGDFDDGPRVRALLLESEVREESRMQEPTIGRRHDADNGPVDGRGVRVGGVNDRHFVRVENDAGTHRVDADQVDEGLH